MGEGMRIETRETVVEAAVEVGGGSYRAYVGDQSFEGGSDVLTEGFIELVAGHEGLPQIPSDLGAGDRLTLDGREFVTTSLELYPRRWRISFESFAEKRKSPSITLSTDMQEAVVDFGDRKSEFVVDRVSTITEVERGAVKANGGSIGLLATANQSKGLYEAFPVGSRFMLDGKENIVKELNRKGKVWIVHFTAVNS